MFVMGQKHRTLRVSYWNVQCDLITNVLFLQITQVSSAPAKWIIIVAVCRGCSSTGGKFFWFWSVYRTMTWGPDWAYLWQKLRCLFDHSRWSNVILHLTSSWWICYGHPPFSKTTPALFTEMHAYVSGLMNTNKPYSTSTGA